MIPVWVAGTLLALQPASGERDALSGSRLSEKGESALGRVKDFELIGKLEGLTDHVYGLAFSADGKRVAASDTNGFATVWEFPKGKLVASFSAALGEEADVSLFHASALNTDGTVLYAGDSLGRVHVWDVEREETLSVIRAHGQAVNGTRVWSVDDMDLSPDGSMLATCGSDGQLRLWSVPGGEPVATIFKHRRALEAVVFAPDGKSVFVGDIDGRLQERTVDGGKVLATRSSGRRDGSVVGLTIDGTGGLVISQHYRGATRVFSQPGLKELRVIGPPEGREEDVQYRGNGVALHPDGGVLAAAYRPSAANHGLVALWDLTTGEELKRFEVFSAVADNVRFSPDGRYLVAAGAEKWVAVFGRDE